MAPKPAKKKTTAARKPARRRAAPRGANYSDVLELLDEADALLEKSVVLREKTRENIAKARREAS